MKYLSTTTWQWQFPGGTPAFSNEKNPVITYETAGIYDVQLRVGNGVFTDSVMVAGYIVADFPTGTAAKTGSFTCTVLPNPGSGVFTLRVNTPQADVLEITIYDMIGTRVFYENNIDVTGQFAKVINLTSQPEGLYFLKIAGKQLMTTQKLIIRK